MQIGLKRELEKANETLDRIHGEVDGLKGIITSRLKDQEPQVKPEKKIKETGHKEAELEQKNIRL